ncbi:MAG: 2'-5' RNA ligase family protein, partial [Mycobacterium sp.]
PLACTVGAPLLFGSSNAVLARLIVPTAELLALHAEVHRTCGPYLVPGPLPNSLPGQWTAHVTVARRVGGPQLERAFRLAGEPSEIHGTVAGLRRWDGTARVEHPIT